MSRSGSSSAAPSATPGRTSSNNACLFMLTSTDRVILVRLAKGKHKGKWTIPGGGVESSDRDSHGKISDFVAARREFSEETGFRLDRKQFTYSNYHIRRHRNGSTTNIVIHRTAQRFPSYDPYSVHHHETDALYYIQLSDLHRLVFDPSYKHHIVNELVGYTKKSLREVLPIIG